MANFDNQDDLDKNALMLQLGAKKGAGAGAEGSPFGGALDAMRDTGPSPGLGGAMDAMRGGGAPTSNTMPIRERAPINDQVAAAPSPLPAPVSGPSGLSGLAGAMQTAASGPVTPMSLTPQLETGTPTTGDQQAPDLGSSIGALAGMFKQPPPLPMEAPRPLQPLPEGAAPALQPRRMPMRPQGRNPLSALAGLFSRRR